MESELLSHSSPSPLLIANPDCSRAALPLFSTAARYSALCQLVGAMESFLNMEWTPKVQVEVLTPAPAPAPVSPTSPPEDPHEPVLLPSDVIDPEEEVP